MPLIPNGKRRLMVAQATPSPASEMAGQIDTQGIQPGQTQFTDQQPEEQAGAAGAEGAGMDPNADPNTDPSALEQAGDQAGAAESAVNQQETQQQSAGKDGDLRGTIMEFLTGLGYPPRRLNEFKSQFVTETGTATTGTMVSIVIPDEVYGKNMQLPREKMKEFVQVIQQKHGLSFQKYKRGDEKLTFDFMTADAAAQQSLENAGPGDILDKVYGTPKGGVGGKGLAPKGAATIQELIKESQDKQLATLRLIVGDKR